MMLKQLKLSILVWAFLFLFQGILSAQSDFFWEQPELFSRAQGNFPVSASSGDLGIFVWQEMDRRPVSGAGGSGDGTISIALAIKKPGSSWENKGIVGGPYVYSGTEPSIISAVIDKQNRILIAVAASTTETEILISSDEGQSFEKYRIDAGTESSVAPRISLRSDGGYLLFVTRGSDSSLSIYYALSDDGRTWSAFRPFITDSTMQLNFLPSHVSYQGREYVIFQSFTGSTETIPTFQLFLKISADNGRTWGPARHFTSFSDAYMYTSAAADNFDNQRPQLSVQGDSLFMVWERRYRTGSPQIYAVQIRADGSIIGAPERINTIEAYCNNPVAFTYNGDTKIIWFDNRSGGNRIYLAQREGFNWVNTDLSGSIGGEASFGRPVVDPDGLFIFWQTTTTQGSTRIYSLLPDTSVNPVRISAGNFTPGRRTRGERVRFSWNIPVDSSGISGFAYAWSKDEDIVPNKNIMVYNSGDSTATSTEIIANDDGNWYFTIIAQDYAGNWSPPSRMEYIRDTIPPPAAAIIQPELDENGFLVSNSFTLNWNPPPASDISGYTWNLQYLGSSGPFSSMDNEIFQAAAAGSYPGSRVASPRVQGTGTSVSYTNQDDGVWLFTVQAIDEVGNVGPLSSMYFRTNKYVPHTFITWVDSSQDEQGVLDLRIIGRGFADGGSVLRVFLDKDGQEPYDREFYLHNNDYTIASDREINGFRIDNLEKGNYRVGVEHPSRGLFITGPMVAIDETGTVKFGDYGSAWQPSWLMRHVRRFAFDTAWLAVIAILVLCGLGILVVIRGIGDVVAESAVIRLDAAALITGDFMPSEKKKRLAQIKLRGIGLRFKMASFTVALVMLVVIMVSAPLYIMMTRTQRETLLQGLWDRSTVLLEGLATNARSNLPQRNILELGFLPAQMSAIPEAQYVTITGYNSDTTMLDHVWATNDPAILTKIDTAEFQPGTSRITDVLTPQLEGISAELDARAKTEVGSISESIASLTQEGISLATRTDAASQQRLDDIQVQTRSLETRVTERLRDIGNAIGSEPQFSLENFAISPDHRYIFFKPILYRQSSDDVFFRGIIRLEVSIDSILQDIARGQQDLLRIIFIVALAAIAIGAVGAFILATLIIQPIRRLVRHVEVIRDTENKSDLEGVDIKIQSHDEIAVLGSTINDMTHGLVKAAAAASDLSIGKEIQKKFIPLDLDREGNKLSSGYKDTKNAHFFGYYEGAKGVSGDYFDYQDLDGRYYAIIKCDVAGKGIPAALIMIQVATMFLNYFKQWKPTEKGMHIEDVVYQINEFIETLAFKGRFAAFTLCLFDSQTGTVRFCNAGDNIIHLFDASEGRMKTLTLPETPATGVLPNFMVQSKGGYSVQTVTIDHGDILLLYTDGIEEAKRRFRNAAFEEITCTEGGAPNDTPHENHVVGQGDEEMGPDRVLDIINAVMNKQVYTLHKWHNPEGETTDLTFDFTSCDGKVEEVIMAMVSVEKMFRSYKDPKATVDNRVLVDRKVDAFLKDHFLQYRNYCSFTRENPGNDSYMYYTHVKEDDQYDDLTILGIKRK